MMTLIFTLKYKVSSEKASLDVTHTTSNISMQEKATWV